MQNVMTQKKDNARSEINEGDIIDWLRQNPDFLQKNPEICDILIPPREFKDRKVADFQKFMVERLREDRDGIIEEAREIVETSRMNMNNLTRFQRAILSILEARDFEDFIQTLVMDCATILNVDILTLVVEAEDGVIPHINMAGVHVVGPGTIDLLMGDSAVWLEGNIRGAAEIFGGGAGLVKSQALIRLEISSQMPPVMIAFGSRDPHGFEKGQATDMLSFFAQVLQRQFRAWLDVPKHA